MVSGKVPSDLRPDVPDVDSQRAFAGTSMPSLTEATFAATPVL
jgi:hypothetical protein